MSNHFPIPSPPPELVEQWRTTPEYTDLSEKLFLVTITTKKLQHIATQAAQWGADQELEACVDWMDDTDCEDPQEAALRLISEAPVVEATNEPLSPAAAAVLDALYEGWQEWTPAQCLAAALRAAAGQFFTDWNGMCCGEHLKAIAAELEGQQ